MSDNKLWAVNFWGSHPSLNNDDCSTGFDFLTEAEARDFLQSPWDVKWYTPEHGFGTNQTPEQIRTQNESLYRKFIPFFELVGSESFKAEVFPNPDYDEELRQKLRQESDLDDLCEQANQAGMAFGIDAYNEYMDYD